MSTLAEAHAIAALISQGSKASYLFKISKTECALSVVSFNVEEQISSPFEIDITVATQDEVVLEDLLDKEGLLTINYGVSKRYFHGIVRECTCIGDNGGYSIFHVYLVPSLWLLSLEQDCRIFQNMNVQDIVCKVLKESGIEGDKVRLALKDVERKREYCVQYRETDLNFISRLLEEEGIFYFFEHHKDKHVIVFADNPSAYLPIQGEKEIRFNVDGGMVSAEESVSSFIYSRRLHPGKVSQRDFNYKRVNLDLTIDKQTKRPTEREVYDYPGNYFKQKKGDLVTQIHKERIQVLGETAEGQSKCPRITPGYVWELTNNDFADKYLTVGVSHSGSQPQVMGEQAGSGGFHYHNNFVVIPSDVIVRPQIVAEKPVIIGVQTATVVGPKGEEIHTDKLGRITVQFHWDRLGKKDDKSSCWIRVAQSWGGLSRGAQYIPRIGDEVLVEFAEGDPDRPIVTGSVYNGDNLPINSLENSKTQSGFRTKTHKGEGFNELRFDDANGAQEVYLQGEKDWNILIKNDKGQRVGHDETLTVGNNRMKLVGVNQTVNVGANHTETIGANKTETVVINKAETIGIAKELTIGGLYQVTVGAAMNETVGGAKAEEVGLTKAVLVGAHMTEKVIGNRAITVGKNLATTVTQNSTLKAKSIVLEADEEIIFKTGSATISMKSSGEIIIKGTSITETASGEIVIKGAKTSIN